MEIGIALIGLHQNGENFLAAEIIKEINSYASLISVNEIPTFNSKNTDAIISHSYDLRVSAEYNNIKNPEKWTFTISDYTVLLLKDKLFYISPSYAHEKYILNSSHWIILIDGDCFRDNDTNNVVKTIKNKYSRIITPLIVDYAENNNEQHPDIIFYIIKKRDISYSDNDITYIIEGAFASFDYGEYDPIIICDNLHGKVPGIVALTIINHSIQQYEEKTIEGVSEASKIIGLALIEYYHLFPDIIINGTQSFEFVHTLKQPEAPKSLIEEIGDYINSKEQKTELITEILFLVFSFAMLFSRDWLMITIGGIIWGGIAFWGLCRSLYKKYTYKRNVVKFKLFQDQLHKFFIYRASL